MNESTQAGQTGLIRGIRRWDLVAVAINGILGAGIFGLPSKVFALIGPYSLLAFLACALVVLLIVLCFAEVGSRFSETGGPYLYARAAFGPVAGFEVGWLMWLARLTAVAANCNLLIEYAAYFWPGINSGWTRIVMITLILGTLTFINVVGVRNAALFSDVSTIAKLIPILLFIGAGFFFLNPQSFVPTAQPSLSDFSQSVLLLIYAFTGFEMAMIPAGEVRDPRRSIPFAILASLGVVAVIYVLIQVVCVGTLPELATSKRPLADAGSHFLGVIGGSVITAGAIISILGNLTVLILAAARLPFAMAGQNELPRIFAVTHPKFRTPHISILLTGTVMLALTLSGSFIYGVTISTIARLLAYFLTCAGLPILRRRETEPPEFKAPMGVPISMLALALIVWLLAHSTRREARDAAIAVVIGLIIYAAYKLKRHFSEK
jgi:APA family basic amino acid/polyamine antiporter